MRTLQQLQYLINAIINFDHFYEYSDDHRVWTTGRENKSKIMEAIAMANLTEEERLLMFDTIGKIFDQRYLDSVERYGNVIAKRPLWNEGDSDIRTIIAGMCGVRGEFLQNSGN